MRIDRLLVDREFAPTRERAQALIMAGLVLADDVPVTKPGKMVAESASLRVKGTDHPYVSRGGVKLAHALDHFAIDVTGWVCIDVGASTGGFTDCLLQRGASRVFAVDVGYGQIAWKLKRDERVVVIERQNIRTLPPEKLPVQCDAGVIDVSFISLELVLPAAVAFIKSGGLIVALIKPQFEVGPEFVGKGGIVRDPEAHRRAIDRVMRVASSLELEHIGTVDSPIEGTKGNKEFVAVFRKK